MFSLSGYHTLNKIYEGNNSLVYRAVRQSDKKKVIVKSLNKDYPTSFDLKQYKREYKIIKSLNIEGVIKAYDLHKYHNGFALVLEDFGGESLKKILEKQSFSLLESLRIALKIVICLEEIHKNNIIHKDFNGDNIVYNCDTKNLKIIDFNIAVAVTRNNYKQETPDTLQGRLAYISPEQTGRINLGLDYRTDFYSFGVTLYQLLTDKLPFESNDVLELIHCHLSRNAIAPHKINPSIPKIVSDIVMKLMAKNPDERYQSAWGIKADLEKCLEDLENQKKINQFTLGNKDISDKFILPESLYGRTQIINDLLSFLFDQKKDGETTLTLICGHSGSGKSSLIKVISQKVNNHQGSFISGKFDQFIRDIPYTAFVSAFRQLVKQKLKQNPVNLQKWKKDLLKNIGDNGQIIIDVIPEIELIIGKQLPVANLSADETEHRFNLIFHKFMSVCATKENPLIIFIDDLQWSDSATLNLIKLTLTQSNTKYISLIGAYRHSEVDENHLLREMIDDVKSSQKTIKEFYLDSLNLEQTNNLIAQTLHRDARKTIILSKLVFNKTRGNPFFTKQFLQILYSNDQIYFNYNNYEWQWNSENIEKFKITDNVVDLIINQLNNISKSLQKTLKIASCLGNTFDLDTLSIIENKPSENFGNDLIKATNLGFVLPLSSDNFMGKQYQFLHDKIYQAIYASIPDQNKSSIHLAIGKLLLKKYTEVEKEKFFFEIVRHFNIGKNLINDKINYQNLIKLNFKASKKAKKSHAYSSAYKYIKTALNLLNIDSWKTNYRLTLNIYVYGAQIAYLNANFQEMEELASEVLLHGENVLDRVKIYKVLISANAHQRKMLSAINIGKKALAELGVELPSNSDGEIIAQRLEKIDQLLRERSVEELIHLPVMRNKKARAVMGLLGILFIPFFQGMPELMPFVGSIMVDLSIKFGNTPASAMGYGIYGLVLTNFLGNVSRGFSFGKLAINVMEKFPEIQFTGITLNLYSGCIHHHQQSCHQVLPLLKKYHDVSVEKGDGITSSCILVYGFTGFFAGIELEVLDQELARYDLVLGEFYQFSAKIYIDIIWQTVLNLRDYSSKSDVLRGVAYDEEIMLPKHEQELELTAIAQVYTCKLLLSYLFGNYNHCQDYIEKVKPYLMTISGIMFYGVYHFYSALTYLALWEDINSQGNILKEIRYHQGILKQWADNAPMNYAPKWHLVEAEKQRILGNKAEAIDHYELAISLSEQYNFINIRAIANELAGKFYLSWGKKKLAQYHLQESFYNYGLWGATAKINDLEEKYPQFFDLSNFNFERDSKSSPLGNTQSDLDLVTVMKASQAITGEIVLENLLQTLMKILLENAGAYRGCLLLSPTDSQNTLDDFHFAIDMCDGIASLNPLVNLGEVLPKSLLYYVIRTREYLVLDNPSVKGYFIHDSYVKSFKPISVICFPLLNQGNLIGVVYLENNVIMGNHNISFRLDMLKLLSGQAAIALRNAQLYNELKGKEELLKQFLEAMPVGVAVLDNEGKPYYANQQAEKILGKGILPNIEKDHIASTYNAYIANTNQLYPNEQLSIIRALEGETSFNDDIEIHNGDRIIPVESWGTPIYDKEGNIEFAMIAFYDNSQRKKAERVLREYNKTLEKEVQQRTKELEKANEQLSNIANLDSLTQIANRRRFDEYLKSEWQRHQRKQENISLLLFDIDYFKPYNDFYGHPQGDESLIQVAQTMKKTLQRPTDLVARYGGEEFVMILPDTSSEGAFNVATTVQNNISSLKIPHEKSLISDYITISIGIATIIPSANHKPEDLIKMADNCLYEAKEKGRNTIVSKNGW